MLLAWNLTVPTWDPEPDCYFHVRTTRTQFLKHAPLSWCEHVRMWWSTSPGHRLNLTAGP